MTDRPPVDLPIFYSADFTLATFAADTTRKSQWLAESLADRPIAGVRLLAPTPLTEVEIGQVHDPAYVTAVRTGEPRGLAESQGFAWDPGLWRMVLASNGGAVAAALTALETKRIAGSLSSGLHHAKRGRGDGYCTFNGVALAVRAAQRQGAGRILILDLDAHCGGGTVQLLGADPTIRQVDVAVDLYDHYDPPAGWTLDVVDDAADYVPTIHRRLRELETAGEAFDLVIYNAGMDPFEGSAAGALDGVNMETLRRRERIVFDWCRWRLGSPVAFVLAGGYASTEQARSDLVELHRGTLEAAARTLAARTK